MNETIVKRIREARKLRGMTQQDLAEHLNKTPSAISDLERGKVQVSAPDLYLIAELLNMPVEYFYGEDFSDDDIQDLVAIIRKQPPDVRKQSIEMTKMLLTMQEMGERLSDSQKQPTLDDVKSFVSTFLTFSDKINQMNEQVNQVRSMLRDALQDRGIEL